jgi:tetratricopeptide (TPR) repeat protein
VTARLVDADAEHVFWTDNYDVLRSDLLHTLDEVAKCIIATLEGRMERAEQTRARARRRSRLDPWSTIWRGRWHLNRLTDADSEEARRLFEEALASHPTSAEALIHLTWWTWYDVWRKRRPRTDVLAFRDLALRTIAADELDSRGHLLAGCAEILLRRPDQALEHLDEATRLNPSLAMAHAQMGSAHMLAGRPAQAIAPLKVSLRLNPQDHYVFYVLGELAAVHCMLGDWDEAIALASRSLDLRPAYWHARMSKICALECSGDLAAAAIERHTLFTQHDKFSRRFIEWLPFTDRRWVDFFAENVLQPMGQPAA